MYKKLIFKVLLVTGMLLFCALPAQAEPPPHAANKATEKRDLDHTDAVAGNLARALIGADEARVLAREYGATGYKPLPPGIRKNLARGKPMPPGIVKTRMPEGLAGRLPLQEGYQWQVAGNDLLLVQAGTALVADILSNVFD